MDPQTFKVVLREISMIGYVVRQKSNLIVASQVRETFLKDQRVVLDLEKKE